MANNKETLLPEENLANAVTAVENPCKMGSSPAPSPDQHLPPPLPFENSGLHVFLHGNLGTTRTLSR